MPVESFKSGEQARVLDTENNGAILVESRSGERQLLALERSQHFQVFHANQINLSVGDKLRITRNGKTADGSDLSNGEIVQVKGFTKAGDIRLTNNRVVAKEYENIVYGYCVTSHASQGKTVDRVLIAQSTLSQGAAYREQFYVSASRFRESIRIYTDDHENLKKSIVKSSRRVSATDMMKGLKLSPGGQTVRQKMWRSAFKAARKRISRIIKNRPMRLKMDHQIMDVSRSRSRPHQGLSI